MVLEKIGEEKRDGRAVDTYELRESAGGKAVTSLDTGAFDPIMERPTWKAATKRMSPTKIEYSMSGAQDIRLRLIALRPFREQPDIIEL